MGAGLHIFISSTCYDLFQERKDITSVLDELGHEVLVSDNSEKFPVSPFLHSYDSCLEAIRTHADLIIVVNRNYGGTDNRGRSITLLEMREAQKCNLPCFVFVNEITLYTLQYWKNNPDGDFKPYIEDNRVFEFIDEVRKQPIGNWLFPYKDAKDLCDSLKLQLSVLSLLSEKKTE